MLEHRYQLLIWIDEKKLAFALNDLWWLTTARIRPVLKLVSVTLVILQYPDIIILQQTSKIEILICHLAGTMNMELVVPNDAFKAMQYLDSLLCITGW